MSFTEYFYKRKPLLCKSAIVLYLYLTLLARKLDDDYVEMKMEESWSTWCIIILIM